MLTQSSNSSSTNPNGLFIESFNPATIGSNLTGGSFVLVNPTGQSFENLSFSLEIDDSALITPHLRLLMPLDANEPFENHTVPLTAVSIGPNQTQTIKLYLYNPDQHEPQYQPSRNIQTYGSHAIKFYITKNTFGDIINGQTLTIPQEKAYLQIAGYSPVEHSNGTWRHVFNSSTNQYQYINAKPNFYQQYYRQQFYPMTENSYHWAYMFNQLGEHYFNVTVHNNSTFPVNKITVNLGGNWAGYALPDVVLQPNETYVFPVVVAINESIDFVPVHGFASGDLISYQSTTQDNNQG